MKKLIHFKFKKSTKGTHCYEEVDSGGPIAIGTLYFKKEALKAERGNDDAPQEIKVTVEI